jgi:hypothetical protein
MGRCLLVTGGDKFDPCIIPHTMNGIGDRTALVPWNAEYTAYAFLY